MLLQDKINIQADRDRVWQVTIDVESWPLWSPAMQKVVRQDSGDFKSDSSALIKQKLMPETRWEVTELDPGSSFSWEAQVMGIKMEATHLLIPCESEVTSVLKIKMEGLLVRVLGPLLKLSVQKALKDENQGLKNFCESKGGSI